MYLMSVILTLVLVEDQSFSRSPHDMYLFGGPEVLVDHLEPALVNDSC